MVRLAKRAMPLAIQEPANRGNRSSAERLAAPKGAKAEPGLMTVWPGKPSWAVKAAKAQWMEKRAKAAKPRLLARAVMIRQPRPSPPITGNPTHQGFYLAVGELGRAMYSYDGRRWEDFNQRRR